MNFFKKHWQVIFIGLLGLIIGAIANYIVNKISNKQLLKELTAQLDQLKAQNKTAKSITDKDKIIALEAQINLLQRQ